MKERYAVHAQLLAGVQVVELSFLGSLSSEQFVSFRQCYMRSLLVLSMEFPDFLDEIHGDIRRDPRVAKECVVAVEVGDVVAKLGLCDVRAQECVRGERRG